MIEICVQRRVEFSSHENCLTFYICSMKSNKAAKSLINTDVETLLSWHLHHQHIIPSSKVDLEILPYFPQNLSRWLLTSTGVEFSIRSTGWGAGKWWFYHWHLIWDTFVIVGGTRVRRARFVQICCLVSGPFCGDNGKCQNTFELFSTIFNPVWREMLERLPSPIQWRTKQDAGRREINYL